VPEREGRIEASEEPTDRLTFPAASERRLAGADAPAREKPEGRRTSGAGHSSRSARPASLASLDPKARLEAARELLRLCEEGDAVPAEVLPEVQKAYQAEKSVGRAAQLRAIVNRLQILHQTMPRDVIAQAPGGRAAPVLRQHLHPRYLLDSCIAATRMSEVYRAWRSADGQQVAIKCLPRRLASEAARREFIQETELLLHLRHPHIVPVLDRGLAGEMPFFVMEYVAGGSLRDYLCRRKMGVERVLRIGIQVCKALAHAHANGVVHLDVKPGNILLDDLDSPRLSDFGIARLAGEQQHGILMAGTRGYAAPEQLSPGYQPDIRSDIYSLSVVLYRLLKGRLPKAEPAPAADLMQGLPSAVGAVLERAMSINPEDRFTDAVDFGDALAACLSSYGRR